MARKTQAVTINDKEIIVKELSVRQVLGLFESDAGTTGPTLPALLGKFQELLPIATGMSVEELSDMTPSELLVVYNVFKEVNSVFFGLMANLGITQILAEIKASTVQSFSGLFANYLETATGKPSGITDMNSSP